MAEGSCCHLTATWKSGSSRVDDCCCKTFDKVLSTLNHFRKVIASRPIARYPKARALYRPKKEEFLICAYYVLDGCCIMLLTGVTSMGAQGEERPLLNDFSFLRGSAHLKFLVLALFFNVY